MTAMWMHDRVLITYLSLRFDLNGHRLGQLYYYFLVFTVFQG